MKWSATVVWVWFVLIAAAVGYELWTNFNGSPRTPTLTDVTVKYLPWWVILPFCVWLTGHFISNYLRVSKTLQKLLQ